MNFKEMAGEMLLALANGRPEDAEHIAEHYLQEAYELGVHDVRKVRYDYSC